MSVKIRRPSICDGVTIQAERLGGCEAGGWRLEAGGWRTEYQDLEQEDEDVQWQKSGGNLGYGRRKRPLRWRAVLLMPE